MKIIIGNSYSTIDDIPDEDTMYLIDEILSVYQPNYYFSDAYKMGKWDGKIRFFNRKKRTFPTGLLYLVAKELKDVEVVDNREVLDIDLPEQIHLLEPKAEGGFITLRDYQYEAVKVALEKTRGIINVATNGGKTEIAAGIIQQILTKMPEDRTILFFTHNKEIFHQSAARLSKRLDMEIGLVGDGQWKVRPVTCVMIPTVSKYIKQPPKRKLRPEQYTGEWKAVKLLVDLIGDKHLDKEFIIALVTELQKYNKPEYLQAIEILGQIYDKGKGCNEEYKKLKEDLSEFELKKQGKSFEKHKKTMDLLESAICFIGDEYHHSSSSTWYDTIMCCTNAVYRFGLTGTVDRKDEVNVMRMIACTGRVIYRISNEFLIERGYSAKPIIYLEEINEPKIKGDDWLKVYKHGIVQNEVRNRKIVERVKEEWSQGKGCLIICNHTKHGEILRKMLVEDGVDAEFTHGGCSSAFREQVLKDMREGKLRCLVATSILDEGVDISNIDAVWLAAGGKSMRQLLQRIGRGLRVKSHGGGVKVFDFIDLHHPLLARHTKDRILTYRAEKFEIKKL